MPTKELMRKLIRFCDEDEKWTWMEVFRRKLEQGNNPCDVISSMWFGGGSDRPGNLRSNEADIKSSARWLTRDVCPTLFAVLDLMEPHSETEIKRIYHLTREELMPLLRGDDE